MEPTFWEYFYNHPLENGYLVFILGILFTLTLYHFLLYLIQREILYLLYSGYTLFILLSQLRHLDNGFIYKLFHPIWPLFEGPSPILFSEIYIFIYCPFALRFMGIDLEFPKWNNFYKWVIRFFAVYAVVFLIIYQFNKNFDLFFNSFTVFTVLMTPFALLLYIPFIKSHSPVKSYMIIGSSFLIISSLVGQSVFLYHKYHHTSGEAAFTILYTGYLLENLFFFLGLGKKQQLVLQDRNAIQEELIAQLQLNANLQQADQQKLENEVVRKAQEIEVERINSLKSEYQKERSELKMVALRSQINPHFIFNSLNSIKHLIVENDRETAVYFMNKFAKLMRTVLSSTMQKEITLEEELQTMELYVNLENVRFNNQIAYSVSISDGLKISRIKVPSLLLQPFLENSIWHGLASKAGDKKLTLTITGGTTHVNIFIEDNGIGRLIAGQIQARRTNIGPGVGISISEERLAYFGQQFQHRGTIEYKDLLDKKGQNIGTQVHVRIPTM